MAAAIVPVAAQVISALPIIESFGKSVILELEKIFPKSGEGQTKMTVATQVMQPVTNQLAAAGTIPGAIDPATIASILQGFFTQMKASGELAQAAAASAPSTASPAPAQPGSASGFSIPKGTVLSFTV